jgi:hypothetical protein
LRRQTFQCTSREIADTEVEDRRMLETVSWKRET